MSRADNSGDRPRIAVAQYAPVHGAAAENRERSLQWIAAAAAGGAALVVLPECCITGLVFENREQLAGLAEPLHGLTVGIWAEIARREQIIVVGGVAERSGEHLHNTAVLVMPSGDVHAYRKTHVFGGERKLFDLGEQMVAVDTPFGKVGMAICYDLWFPEVARSLSLAGVSMIASPSNWFVPPRQAGDGAGELPMAYHHAASAACANEITIACADRVGEEGGVRFLGCSFIMGPTGRALAGPAPADQEALLFAEWSDPADTRRKVQSHLETRRAHLYALPVTVL